MWDKVWTFKTARFEVGLEFGPEDDLDLSWDEDGAARAGLENGALFAFVARTYVKLDGATIGECFWRPGDNSALRHAHWPSG